MEEKYCYYDVVLYAGNIEIRTYKQIKARSKDEAEKIAWEMVKVCLFADVVKSKEGE